MCLAVPGKVIEIKDDKFIVDYGPMKREAIGSAVEDIKKGDYVILNNKIIIKKMSEKEYKEFLEVLE